MRRYFFQIQSERGTDDDPVGVVLSDHGAAMLRAVTMSAEIGVNGGFYLGFAINVWDERGATIGRVSVVMATASPQRHDA